MKIHRNASRRSPGLDRTRSTNRSEGSTDAALLLPERPPPPALTLNSDEGRQSKPSEAGPPLSRSVVVRMRKRAPNEKVEPFRRRQHVGRGDVLRDCLAAWGESVRQQLTAAWPEMPDGIEDRDADVWEALLAVADAADGDWPERARVSAVSLVTESKRSTPSLGVRLLADIPDVFKDTDRDVLPTDALLRELHEIDESPWGDLRGKPLDVRGLARRVKPYDVAPKVVRIGEGTVGGYSRGDFTDAWSRYLPTVGSPHRGSVTSETAKQPSEQCDVVTPVTDPYAGVPKDLCAACRFPLDPALAAIGVDRHPNCEEAA